MTRKYVIEHRSPEKPDLYSKNNSSAEEKESSKSSNQESSSLVRLGVVIVAFVAFAIVVKWTWKLLPSTEEEFRFPPRSLKDAQQLGAFFHKYTGSHYWQVVVVYVSTYVFLQTFAIPGSIFLSILAGYLFYFPMALFLVCLSAAVGATCANRIACYVGKRVIESYASKRVNLEEWRRTVKAQSDNLFNYMIFLRITPLIPNFVINIAAPMVHFPTDTFMVGTFFGVALPSIFFINAGYTLQQLTAQDAKPPLWTIPVFFVLGFASLLPVLYKERLKKKMLGSS